MEAWHREIVELHEFFEAYFAGALPVDAISRLEWALAPGFTIVAPGGGEASRSETIDSIRAAHGSSDDLRMEIDDARLIRHGDDWLLARYVERHVGGDATTERVSTVVFTVHDKAPNGLQWQTVHETWL